MKSVSKHPLPKGQTISYYLKLDPTLAIDNLFLGINGQQFPLKRDKDLFFIFNGKMVFKSDKAENKLHVELHGTSSNKKRITGKINLTIGSVDFGYFTIDAPVKIGSFKCVIGDLPLGKYDMPESGSPKSKSVAKKAVSKLPKDKAVHKLVKAKPSSKPLHERSFPERKKGAKTALTESIWKHTDLLGNVSSGKKDFIYPKSPSVGNSPDSPKSAGRKILKDDSDKKSTVSIKDDPGGEVTVFYGTNRKKIGDKPGNYYGSELGDLEQGLCIISIPPGHKQGALERPGKVLWWKRKENPAKDIVLKSIRSLSSSDFFDYLNSGLKKADNKAALIFVHGFNTSFEEAAWRCGQICYDVPFSGITGFFGWPSAGGALDYVRDMERADASVTNLTNFIENIVLNTGVEELHFIGHSMGNRILTRSLNQLIQKESFKNKINTIAQVILAAPDIDIDVFNKEIYPTFRTIGKRRTIYASDKDLALFVSDKIRGGLKRVGEAGTNIYVVDGMDTIDASNVMSKDFPHHSYMFEEKELLHDMNTLFVSGTDPKGRGLTDRTKKVNDSSLKYWLFRG